MDSSYFFFFQAEDGIRDVAVTGVQTCALPIFARLTPALLGELVNLVGHDREAAAVHARARRLDRGVQGQQVGLIRDEADGLRELLDLDRKSTRLNSSHGYISYAVFCLKKKTKTPPVSPSV